MDSVEPTTAFIVVVTDLAKSVWDALHTTYSNRSQSQAYILHDKLACVTNESRSITHYIHALRSLSDEIATTGTPVSHFKIHTCVCPKFLKIFSAIRARDTTISYVELFEKLLDYELFLHHDDAKKLSNTITTSLATPT